jgi:hypothetical protein
MSTESAAENSSAMNLVDRPASGTVDSLAVQMTVSATPSSMTETTTVIALRQTGQSPIDSSTMPLKRTLTVRNYSSRPQSFVLLASPPAFAPLAVPDIVRHCVYQASMLVATETGSHTFVIPILGGQAGVEDGAAAAGPVYAVTGSARQKPEAGVTLFVSDVHTLREGDGVGPGERCVMTMPDGFEAAFSKAKMPKDPDDDDPVANSKGTVGIEVDNSFGFNPHYPFVGLGAPNPYKPREVVPLVTWDAVPGNAYLIRPNLHTWVVARDSAEKGAVFDLTQGTKTQAVSFAAGDDATEVIFEKNGTFTLVKDGV